MAFRSPPRAELAPPVVLPGEERVVVPGIDGGPALEAMLRAPAGSTFALVLCHAHSLYGGCMHCRLMVSIAEALAAHDAASASLRFNYRGVGDSEGTFAGGRGETMDARAALRFLRERAPRARLALCGHSFGSGVSLRAAIAEGTVGALALVAPGAVPRTRARSDVPPTTVFVGDSDEHTPLPRARALAEALGATLEVLPGADHFFVSARERLAAAVVGALLGLPDPRSSM